MYEEDVPDAMHYERGFPLGFSATPPGTDKKHHYIFNHIAFLISYHQEDGKAKVDPANKAAATASGSKYRIVGFEVEPYSIKHRKKDSSKVRVCESVEWDARGARA